MVTFATSVVYVASRLALHGPARYGIDADERQSIELTSGHALLLPIAASLALVAMYFLFDSIQAVFLMLHVFVAFYCSYPLISSALSSLLSSVYSIRLPFIGRVSTVSVASSIVSLALLCIWIITANWVAIDLLGAELIVFMLTLVRVPSLRVASAIYAMLLLYDVFWVFESSHIFADNVMMVRLSFRCCNQPLSQRSTTTQIIQTQTN